MRSLLIVLVTVTWFAIFAALIVYGFSTSNIGLICLSITFFGTVVGLVMMIREVWRIHINEG